MPGCPGRSAFTDGVRILAGGGNFREVLGRAGAGYRLFDIKVRDPLEGVQRRIADMSLQRGVLTGRNRPRASLEKKIGQAHTSQLDGIKVPVLL